MAKSLIVLGEYWKICLLERLSEGDWTSVTWVTLLAASEVSSICLTQLSFQLHMAAFSNDHLLLVSHLVRFPRTLCHPCCQLWPITGVEYGGQVNSPGGQTSLLPFQLLLPEFWDFPYTVLTSASLSVQTLPPWGSWEGKLVHRTHMLSTGSGMELACTGLSLLLVVSIWLMYYPWYSEHGEGG